MDFKIINILNRQFQPFSSYFYLFIVFKQNVKELFFVNQAEQ